jgi:hypothetical protein
MSIQVGDKVPDGTLGEFIETATESCAIGPNNFQVADLHSRRPARPSTFPAISNCTIN